MYFFKKIAAAVFPIALVVGLIPSTALAVSDSSLQPGSLTLQSANLSAQSIMPKNSKTTPRSLYAIYRPALKKAATATGPFKEYQSVLNSGYDAKYALYDMDSDGVPELVIFAGFYGAGGQNCYVYTVKGGKLKYCGSTNAGFGGVSGGPKCLYISQAHQGFVGYWTVKLNSTKLVRETAFEGTDTDADGSLRAFMSKAREKVLTWSQCTSYSLLKEKAKLASGKVFDAAVAVQSSAAYTGKAVEPKMTVKYLGTTLKTGRDYVVAYRNAKGKKITVPKAVGTYKVTVKGKGKYKGSATRTFKVVGKASSALSLSKAKKAYSPILKSLKAENYLVYYKYADIVGDKTVELVAYAFPTEGMRSHDYIYTIKSGKPRLVHDRTNYGYWGSLTYRKGAKSLVYFGSGHGGDSYLYLKFSGGKYEPVAWKSRAWGSSAWSYSVPEGTSTTPVSKSAFNKKVKGLIAGKGTKLDLSWDKMAEIKNEANRQFS